MKRTNRTRYAVLFLLRTGPLSGYDIRKMCQTQLRHFWDESFGQIYPTLNTLVEDGHIQPVREQGASARPKQRYRITKKGREALVRWLIEPPAPRSVRDELLLKISCATEVGREVHIRHLRDAEREAAVRLAELRAAETMVRKQFARHPDRIYWEIAIRGGVALLEARRSWCQESADALEASEE